MKIERGGFVALAVAVGAGDVEVGEKLHFDLFETVSGAAVAAAGTGVEGEETGVEITGLGLGSAGEELADGIEGTEENGGSGARGSGDGGLIDELDTG